MSEFVFTGAARVRGAVSAWAWVSGRFRPAMARCVRVLVSIPGVVLALSVAAGAADAADARGLPVHLSETGFYSSGRTIRADLLPFSPQYPLWSDGAAKRRWIYLPPGTSIDASQPDAWEFPRGTKLWKEFSHGRALETRYLERGADGTWRFGSYVWTADGTDAVLASAEGMRDLHAPGAPGGRYTIPSENDCRACHEAAPVPVLGFSALQLSPDRDPLAPHTDAPAAAVDLRTLVRRGLISHLPATLQSPRIVASSPAERAALGYLHGNCGHCHNADGPLAVLDMTLAQRVAGPASENPVLTSIVGVESQFHARGAPPGAPRIAPGREAASVIALRMASRDPLQRMPPLGSVEIDADAMSLIGRWIDSLSATH